MWGHFLKFNGDPCQPFLIFSGHMCQKCKTSFSLTSTGNVYVTEQAVGKDVKVLTSCATWCFFCNVVFFVVRCLGRCQKCKEEQACTLQRAPPCAPPRQFSSSLSLSLSSFLPSSFSSSTTTTTTTEIVCTSAARIADSKGFNFENQKSKFNDDDMSEILL